MKGASYWRSADQASYVLEGWEENLEPNAVKILTVILGCLGFPVSVVMSTRQFDPRLHKATPPRIDVHPSAGRL